MPHRRHRPPLGQGDAAMFGGPVGQAFPREFRPPAEPPRQWRERQLEHAARAAFGADVIDQDELAAGFQDADEIIQCPFRIRHRRDDILRDDDVERAVRKREMLCIHHGERLDIVQAMLGDTTRFLKDGDTAVLQQYKSEIVGVDLPAAVELAVTDTEPGVQGDRVQGARKPAKLETGIVVQVPLFVNTGDRVKVDTRSGEYLTRV